MNVLNTEDIEIEELKESHREYANIIGLDNLIELCKAIGGTQIYIPTYIELLRPIQYKKAIEEVKNGMSVKKAASKYGISESTIYNWLRDNIKNKI